mmetsp:Transcript_11751/g.26374  ORF Transcript_11751/g.26374 Transcript_11751/m.26374 type:complete len:248 (-) Transcript_11751:55-798(-)
MHRLGRGEIRHHLLEVGVFRVHRLVPNRREADAVVAAAALRGGTTLGAARGAAAAACIFVKHHSLLLLVECVSRLRHLTPFVDDVFLLDGKHATVRQFDCDTSFRQLTCGDVHHLARRSVQLGGSAEVNELDRANWELSENAFHGVKGCLPGTVVHGRRAEVHEPVLSVNDDEPLAPKLAREGWEVFRFVDVDIFDVTKSESLFKHVCGSPGVVLVDADGYELDVFERRGTRPALTLRCRGPASSSP